MLRISRMDGPDDAVTLRLEGRVMGPWVAELDQQAASVRAQGRRLILALGEVEFIDRQGLALLRGLLNHQVELAGCPPLVAEQLREARSCR